MSDKPKLCPFCRGTDVWFAEDESHEECWLICNACGCRGPKVPLGADDGSAAYTAWDTRADDWISVKDRLPEMELHNGTVQSEAVLAASDYGDIGVSITYETPSGRVQWDSTDVGGRVTHWKPIEPPIPAAP